MPELCRSPHGPRNPGFVSALVGPNDRTSQSTTLEEEIVQVCDRGARLIFRHGEEQAMA
jgi:hypothetical protein